MIRQERARNLVVVVDNKPTRRLANSSGLARACWPVAKHRRQVVPLQGGARPAHHRLLIRQS